MKSDRVIIICLALLLLAVTCNTSKQSNLFIGTWKFISLSTESSVGDIYLPYGENPFGRLMYDHNGNRSAFLMRPNRPKFESGDIYNGTPEEIKSAFENFDAYYGTYKIDMDKKTVTHFVEGSRFPNQEKTEQVRFYEFKNDTLLLSATLSAKGNEWTASAILVKL